MRKLFITGAAGFIGSNFVNYLHQKRPELEIVIVDKLTYAGFRENIYPAINDDNVQLYFGDICDYKLVEDVMRGCDTVINFAAETHVDRSLKDPTKFLRTNVFGTYQLLKAAMGEGVKRFLQISTDEVYGSLKEGHADEQSPLNSSNPYSATKAAADLLCLSYHNSFDFPVLITRSSNTYGPRQYPEKIIPLFIKLASREQQVPIYGDGLNIRDWLFIDDLCSALLTILEKGKAGEVYNIAAKNYHTNIELTKTLLEALDKSDELISYVTDRPGHDYRYAIENKKIIELGWTPKVKLRDGLDETIEWYRNNPYLLQVET